MDELSYVLTPIAIEFDLDLRTEGEGADVTVYLEGYCCKRSLVPGTIIGQEVQLPGYRITRTRTRHEMSYTQSPAMAAMQMARYAINDILRERVEARMAEMTGLDGQLMLAFHNNAAVH